ncbi:hypothetical protein [Endozoicomonas sp. SESOKO1]|nr:hypothetical protein [Endozoicomonas sp. SESOKO1]
MNSRCSCENNNYQLCAKRDVNFFGDMSMVNIMPDMPFQPAIYAPELPKE